MDHYYWNIQGWFTFPSLYKTVIGCMQEGSHMVEVGAWMGQSTAFAAVEIANSGKNIKFDVIDTWQGSVEHNLKPDEQNALYMQFLENMQPVKHIINPIRMASLEAAKTYPDKSIDFIFIDASHEYEDVKADLDAWYMKLRKGGIIAGHDYFDPSDPEHGHKFPGVKKAVDEFFQYSPGLQVVSGEYCWVYQKL